MYHIRTDARLSQGSLLEKISAYRQVYATPANLIGLGGALGAIFCLLALPSSNYWNIRLPLYLVVAVWTLLRPRVALYLLPIAVPWGSLDPIALGGLNLNSTDILVVLLATSWLLSFLLPPSVVQCGPLDRDSFNTPRYLVWSMLALLLAMFLSLAVTRSFSLSLKEIVKWVEAFVVLVLGTQYIRTRRQIWTLVILICLAAISQAIFGYAQYAFNLGPASFIRNAGLRVYGTFDQPNPYAGYINMSLAVVCALLILGKGIAVRVLSGLTLIMLVGAEILTQSKGGYLAIAVAILFIALVVLSRPLILAMVITVSGVISLYLVGLLPESSITAALQKVGLVNLSFTYPTTVNYANSERLAHWVAGIRMFLDHPFLGVGMGNYAIAYPQYAQGIFVISLLQAHNYYINIAAEAGIFGLLGLFSFLTAMFVAGGHVLRTLTKRCLLIREQIAHPRSGILIEEAQRLWRSLCQSTNDRALAIGLLAALLSVCVHNLVDDLYDHGMTLLFVLLLVLLIRLEGGSFNKKRQRV